MHVNTRWIQIDHYFLFSSHTVEFMEKLCSRDGTDGDCTHIVPTAVLSMMLSDADNYYQGLSLAHKQFI